MPSCRTRKLLSLRFNGHFPGEPGLAGVYWSKGWWRWWWQLDYRLDALPVAQPTVSKHWREKVSIAGVSVHQAGCSEMRWVYVCMYVCVGSIWRSMDPVRTDSCDDRCMRVLSRVLCTLQATQLETLLSLSDCLFICLSVCLSVYLSVCLSVCRYCSVCEWKWMCMWTLMNLVPL